MRKIMLAGILILFTVSCAPLMEETWTVTTPKGPVTVRHYDPARELLLGFYISSLITNPPKAHNDLLLSSYYYPLIIPRVQKFGSLPTWEDVLYDMEVESAIRNQLRDYESEVEHINDMELWRLKTDTQRMIDDIESAKERAKDELESKKKDAEDAADELEDAAYDAKLELKRAANKLEDAAWWAKFRLESAAENADFERLVAENAGTTEEQRKTFSTEEIFPDLHPTPPPGFVLDKKETAAKKAIESSALNLDWLYSIPPKIETTPQVSGIEKKPIPEEESDLIDLLSRIPVKTETATEISGAKKELGPKGESDLADFLNRIPPKEMPLGGEIGQIIGKSEDQVEVTQWFGSSAVKKFVSVGVDYAKKARGFVFLLEVPMPGEVVVYGSRWPPKDPINWREEKEVSRIVKNGLANAIKEIIDELGER
jgi:hypothetical protein